MSSALAATAPSTSLVKSAGRFSWGPWMLRCRMAASGSGGVDSGGVVYIFEHHQRGQQSQQHVRRMHISSKLESVRIGKCQNRKVSELESVRIGKCQKCKLSELESVRIGKCQNWMCQNRKVSELESVRIVKCQNFQIF